MDPFIASIPDQIAYYEDAIECLKSRLRFYRTRLKKLKQIIASVEDETFIHKENDNG